MENSGIIDSTMRLKKGIAQGICEPKRVGIRKKDRQNPSTEKGVIKIIFLE